VIQLYLRSHKNTIKISVFYMFHLFRAENGKYSSGSMVYEYDFHRVHQNNQAGYLHLLRFIKNLQLVNIPTCKRFYGHFFLA